MRIFAKARHNKGNWPVTDPVTDPATDPVIVPVIVPGANGHAGGALGTGKALDIDLERVVYDPEYRKRVLRRLNRTAETR